MSIPTVEIDENEAFPAPFLSTTAQQDTEVLVQRNVVSPFYIVWHKTMDIAFAFCGSIVLIILLPTIALLIVLNSPGPIFYSQERVGYRGKKFRIFKFRSMYSNAEASGQAMWATERDRRITPVGRFMRAFHLDELPQVFNILRGEMSLIGPRPERETFVDELEKHIPLYRHRLVVKPGLTGWAQVNYHYARSIEDSCVKSEYDLYYIEHQSVKLDIIILIKTVVEVLSHHGT